MRKKGTVKTWLIRRTRRLGLTKNGSMMIHQHGRIKMANQIQNLTRATLASLSTLPRVAGRPPSSSAASKPKETPKMKHPCKTKWQQKWIGLSVVSPDIQRLAD